MLINDYVNTDNGKIRVKLFVDSYDYHLTVSVNRWLEENPDMILLDISVGYAAGKCVGKIIYKEPYPDEEGAKEDLFEPL